MLELRPLPQLQLKVPDLRLSYRVLLLSHSKVGFHFDVVIESVLLASLDGFEVLLESLDYCILLEVVMAELVSLILGLLHLGTLVIDYLL